MDIERDILDLIKLLPEEVMDISVATEVSFVNVGDVLWKCREEIQRLRAIVCEGFEASNYVE